MADYNTDSKASFLKIHSCYNVGMMEANTVAGIMNLLEEEINEEVDNCFMSDYNNGYGEIVTDDFMKTDEFVSHLNKYESLFIKDVEPFVNDGYPIINYSKINEIIGLDETIVEANISIYPNPASDIVKISADSGQLSNAKVYNCLGMLVEEKEVNASEVEINVSDYNSGIYFIEADGIVSKFVVK